MCRRNRGHRSTRWACLTGHLEVRFRRRATFPGTAALSRPMRVFMGQTPQKIIVVVQSDFFQSPTHAVYTLDVTGL